MRLLMVSPTGGLSGADQALLTLAQGLSQRPDWTVHVAGPKDMATAAALKSHGVHVHAVETTWWFPPSHGLDYVSAALKGCSARVADLRRIMAQHEIDAVLSNTIVALDGAIAARLAGLPHVFFIHALFVPGIYTKLNESQRSEIYRAVAAGGDALVCPSAAVASDLDSLLGRPGTVNVVPNGVDTDRFRPSIANPSPVPTVGVIGHLNENKNQRLAVAVAARVRAQGVPFRMRMVGPAEPAYGAQVREDIRTAHLDGVVSIEDPVDDIRPILDGIDVLLSTSTTETFPISMLEAMAAGKPIVSTATAGAQEIVVNGETGVVSDDPGTLADGLSTYLTDAEHRRATGESARRRCVEAYSVATMAEGFATIIQTVVQRRESEAHAAQEDSFWSCLVTLLERSDLRRIAVAQMVADPDQTATKLLSDLPFADMRRLGVDVTRLTGASDELYEVGADVAWILRSHGADAGELVASARVLGLPVVYETDDNFDAIEYRAKTTRHATNADGEGNESFRAVVRQADVVLVHAAALAVTLEEWADDVVLQQPAVFSWADPVEKTAHEGLVVGAMGSLKRDVDFEFVVPALLSLLDARPDLRVEFFGFVPELLAGHPRVWHAPFDSDYERFLEMWRSRHWDVAIAPLAATPFNESKTDNKFREFAASGIPGIYSDVGPYRSSVRNGIDGLLVQNTPGAWEHAIRSLLDDRGAAHRIADNAIRTARRRYNPERYRFETLALLHGLERTASTMGTRRIIWDASTATQDLRERHLRRLNVRTPWTALHVGTMATDVTARSISVRMNGVRPGVIVGVELLERHTTILASSSISIPTRSMPGTAGALDVVIPIARTSLKTGQDLWLRVWVEGQPELASIEGYRRWTCRWRRCSHAIVGFGRG